jgi:hypothetical protein
MKVRCKGLGKATPKHVCLGCRLFVDFALYSTNIHWYVRAFCFARRPIMQSHFKSLILETGSHRT